MSYHTVMQWTGDGTPRHWNVHSRLELGDSNALRIKSEQLIAIKIVHTLNGIIHVALWFSQLHREFSFTFTPIQT